MSVPMTMAQDKAHFTPFRPYGSQRLKAVIVCNSLVLFAERRRIVLVQLISKFPPLVENLLGLFRDSRQQNRAK